MTSVIKSSGLPPQELACCIWDAQYPEQWPRERWTRDIELMRQPSMNVVCIGDYAWSRLEPSEKSYDLDWLQDAVDTAAEEGHQGRHVHADGCAAGLDDAAISRRLAER